MKLVDKIFTKKVAESPKLTECELGTTCSPARCANSGLQVGLKLSFKTENGLIGRIF
jgi:hypothetical protein